MHGRVKVRTSEEEKLRKKKARSEKLKLFQSAMGKIQLKRKEGELDSELLEITGNVLAQHPDVYTLWNIRRDIISIFQKSSEDDEEVSELFDAELSLTEHCLKVNPKSYCAWHQREWVLITRKDPDWKKELLLCNIYLKLDERNFHTWDYRRFVVTQSKTELKDEFEFTTEKLHENFSNYSAWHNRSKMLVQLYPDLEAGRPIEDSHHKHELELVQNAAFTDPDDTSAWFYQRWLLSAVKESTQIVVCTLTDTRSAVAFNKHVSKELIEDSVKLFIDNTPIKVNWLSCTGNLFDNLWISYIPGVNEHLDAKIEFKGDGVDQLIPLVQVKSSTYIGKAKISFQRNYSKPVIEELKKQLEACRQLLELEPDNKWTLLTTTVFLHCIDPIKYHNETIDKLQMLKKLDKYRIGYYDDLITKWTIEEYLISKHETANELEIAFKFTNKLSSLPHMQYFSFCEKLDLSKQNLISQALPSLVMLPNCKVLNLSNNKLRTLKSFPKMELEELILTGNEELDENEIKLFKEKVNYKVIY